MTSLSLSREEFAAKRRSEQDDLVERLQGVIGATFSTGDIEPLLVALENIYTEVYEAEVESLTAALTPSGLKAAIARFLKVVRKTLSKADEDSNVNITSLALANAVLNDATASAYGADVEMEWVSMQDEAVRHTHDEADGQRQPIGEKFTVGEALMRFPGDLTAPIEEWINCRCTLKPVERREASAALVAALIPMQSEGFLAISAALFDEAVEKGIAVRSGVREDGVVLYDLDPEGLLAAAEKEQGDWFAIMAVPAEDEAVHSIGNEDKHATVIYFGEVSDPETIETIGQWVAQIAADAQPFTATVKEVGELGHDDEKVPVWLLDESDLNGLHAGLMADETVKATYDAADTTKYPEYVPHVTISDGEVPEEAAQVTEIKFDRLALWHGGQHTDYPLGADMADEQTDPIAEIEQGDDNPAAEEVPEDTRIPWHGQLAPEGVRSGDGRMFTNLGRTRDLPLPLTWQEKSAGGHDDNITVATIEKIAMIDGIMEASGYFLSSVDEADEVIGLLSEFGEFGVSVDADDIGSASFDEDEDLEVYDDPRISSACIVSIPAFATGAKVRLGKHPILDADPDASPVEEVAASSLPLLKMAGVPESYKNALIEKYSGTTIDDAVANATPEELAAAEDWAEFADVAPGRTEDGPGWLTHPVDTDRLRDYWVRGPGAAKIGWGVAGDFNRCRVNVAEYVKPQYLNGYCANRHYDALGIWPGREAAASGEGIAAQIATRIANGDKRALSLASEPAPTLTLVASGGRAGYTAPAEFFAEPVDMDPDDGVVIDPPNEDGLMRTYGYVAEWGVCHIGYDGMCKEAPPSVSNYAYFRTGQVNTPDGPVKVGALTAATGHANPRLKAMPAAAHYDDTGSVWALVTTGENERGIWFSGLVKPGADETLLNDVVASGRISGDWRPIGADLELVAGLTVNVPGFPIEPTRTAAHDGRQLSLVAAGVPAPKIEESPAVTLDLNDPEGLSLIASLVVDEMESRKARRDRLDALKQKVEN